MVLTNLLWDALKALMYPRNVARLILLAYLEAFIPSWCHPQDDIQPTQQTSDEGSTWHPYGEGDRSTNDNGSRGSSSNGNGMSAEDQAYYRSFDEGIAAFNNHQWADAERIFRWLASLHHEAAAYANLGNAIREQGRYREAEEALREALSRDSKLQCALMGLAWTVNEEGIEAAHRGDYQSAVNYYQTAVENDPDEKIYANNLLSAKRRINLQEEKIEEAKSADKMRETIKEIASTVSSSESSDIKFTTTRVGSPQIDKIEREIKNIQVPPPIPPSELSIRFGQLPPEDEASRKVLDGTEEGVVVLELGGQVAGNVIPLAKVIIATGSTIIAAEDAADVYLVRKNDIYETALKYLRDESSRMKFTNTVRSLRLNLPLGEDTDVEMVRVARAMLDPELGNSGSQIAWGAMVSPEARNAFLTKACIEMEGEIIGAVSGRIFTEISARRNPVLQKASDELIKVTKALSSAEDPAEREMLERIIVELNEKIDQVYRMYEPGAHGLEEIESVFTKHKEQEYRKIKPRE